MVAVFAKVMGTAQCRQEREETCQGDFLVCFIVKCCQNDKQ